MKKALQIFAIITLTFAALFAVVAFDQKAGFGKINETLESRK
jgi:hypothetical protein